MTELSQENYDKLVVLFSESIDIATDTLLPIIGSLGAAKQIGSPSQTIMALLLCAATLNEVLTKENGNGVPEEAFCALGRVAFAAAPPLVAHIYGELDDEAA